MALRVQAVKSLSSILPRGAEGGTEFGRIVNLLLAHEARKQGINFTPINTSMGSYYGLDGFIYYESGKVGLLYKFFPSPLNSRRKSIIIDNIKQVAVNRKELMINRLILVTPDDFSAGGITWLESLQEELSLDFGLEHWGHTRLISLFMETPSLRQRYYPELVPKETEPQELTPPEGNLLLHLELQKIGSVEQMLLEPAHRLNVITGDNGLGKTFLLECAWWALSGEWAGIPAYPMEQFNPGDARLSYRVGGPHAPGPPVEASYDLKKRAWTPMILAPNSPSLLLYARIDGSFAAWDSSKNYNPDTPDSPQENDSFYSPLVFTKNDVWDGYETRTGGKSRVLLNGLIRDWITWQNKPDKYPFDILKQVLSHLSPPDMGPLEPDEPMRIPGDARDIPTLKHPYGRVPVHHVSASVRRIVSLAYLVVWLWWEHRAFSQLAFAEPLKNMVVLIDEIEAHLHPQWQRSILPALLKVREALAPNLHIQFIAATHSPLVMASMEPVFEEEKDKLFHLALKEGKGIHLEEMPFQRCGRVDSWLMSDVFQLRHARSMEAEKAISS